jgi:UDP-N-acetyl-D-glucosamine/UDP-N-acetyl-D-galactosamine dehydrogenase
MLENPFSGAPVKIGVIGLGYVGLPLAAAFGRLHETVGFDAKPERIAELQAGVDRTQELSAETIAAASGLSFAAVPAALDGCNVFIVTVPTPIDRHKRPDMSALFAASRTVGGALKPGAVVVYESTVYPGATEETCVPILEEVSGLSFNRDFFVGYSPERANPGDRAHRLESIVKVTAGSTPEAADFVDALYASIVGAGTHRASSIRVAEAAKVIENTQRDLNIALINEFALIFDKLGLDTHEVLAAAGTKWNFLRFQPGLVGGHCIGVDPYYLTYKAQEAGYHPEVILAGRRINDSMGEYVAARLVKALIQRGGAVREGRALVMGLAFKENCPDLRNSRVIDVVRALRDYGMAVDVHDPWADPEDALREYDLKLVAQPDAGAYDAVVVAVSHQTFHELGAETIRAFGKPGSVIFDVKAMFPKAASDLRL